MKKKKIFCLVLLGGSFLGAFLGNKVYAEESNTDETVEVEKSKTETFLEEWAVPTISAIMGLLGSCGGYLLLKRLVDKLGNKIEKDTSLSKEQREEAQKTYEDAIKLLNEAKETYEKEKVEFKEQVKALNNSNINTAKLKTLIALLVSSSPELVQKGYAKKILELLDEGKEDERIEEEGTE